MLKNLNKKVLIISAVFILILAVSGGFFWWQNRETPTDKWMEAKMSQSEDYKIKETAEGKFVENEKVGLTFKIPDGWVVDSDDPSVLHTSDIEISGQRSDILQKGCRIYIDVSYIKTNLDNLEKFLDNNFLKLSSIIILDASSKTELHNSPVLMYEYHVENIEMAYVSVDLSFKDKVYKILLINPIQEKERCNAEFDKFLETVSIK